MHVHLYTCVHEIKREMLVHASRTFFLYKLENFILYYLLVVGIMLNTYIYVYTTL